MPQRFHIAPMCLAAVLVAVAGLAGGQEPEPRPEGDIITFNSGAQMAGVKVLRKTATNYKVQVVDGVVMEVPVSQVSHIEYAAEHETTRGRHGGGDNGAGDEIWAQEMSPELNTVLTQPLEEPLSLREQDMIAALHALSERYGFEVEINESVHEIPADERRWAVEIPEGGTLLRLFRDELPARFPQLMAVTQFDRVVIASHENDEPIDDGGSPPGDEEPLAFPGTEPAGIPDAPDAP